LPEFYHARGRGRLFYNEGVPQTLVGKELSELVEIVAARGEPAFRARQLHHGLYRRGHCGLGEIRTLPGRLREALEADFAVGQPEIQSRVPSADGTVRYLLRLADGKTIEAVFLPEEDRDTLCISSQAGCAVDCKFCLTALMGLERNLTAGEIAGQVLALFREHGLDPRSRQVNIVMMGMGEPLLNLDAVLKAVRLLSDPDGAGVPLKRITVSTSGIIPQMEALARAPERPKLAVSLNASTQQSRERLMPVTRKYRLEDLIAACRRYPLRPWERLTFEYVLLKDVNDSDADARRVAGMLAPVRAKVNLIPFNPGPGVEFETPEPERVLAFQRIVRRSLPCFIRKPRGRDISAACGQLKRTLEDAALAS